MSTYKERKDRRTKEYNARHGVKMVPCIACNGSGVYDNTGSPPCWSCDGKGKVLDEPVPESTPEQKIEGAINYALGRMAAAGCSKARAAQLAADLYGVPFRQILVGIKAHG